MRIYINILVPMDWHYSMLIDDSPPILGLIYLYHYFYDFITIKKYPISRTTLFPHSPFPLPTG